MSVDEYSCDHCGTNHNMGNGSLNVKYLDDDRVCHDCWESHSESN